MLLALLTGCGEGGRQQETEAEAELSCAFDPHSWYDNAYHTLLQADEDGSFSFDPVGTSVAWRSGSYDYTTGDYYVTNTYLDGYYLLQSVSAGYGTIYDDGDLDLIAKQTYEDVLGESWAEQVRTKRSGCVGSVKRTEVDLDHGVDEHPDEDAEWTRWTTEIVSDEQVDSHLEAELEEGTYISHSVSTPSVASQYNWDYADGAYTGDGTWQYDGTGQDSFIQYGETFGYDYDYYGTNDYYFDGSRYNYYIVYQGGTDTWAADVALLWLYDGSATGTYDYAYGSNIVECEITIDTSGYCWAECGSYGSGEC